MSQPYELEDFYILHGKVVIQEDQRDMIRADWKES